MAQTFKSGFDDAVGKMTILEADKIKAEEEEPKTDKAVEDQLSGLKLNEAKAKEEC
jgi:hypothetical protein